MAELEIRVYHWALLDSTQRRALSSRVEAAIPAEVERSVREIIEAVRQHGDAALLRYTRKFDGADLRGRPLRVGEEELAGCERHLSKEVKAAVAFAVQGVRLAHEPQRPADSELRELRPGVFVGERFTPIPSAGLYVPRGRGSFPSVMYMQAIPARIAGVKRIAAVSAPDREGQIDAATMYAARLCGVEELYRVGGVQAIAALAFGTESIPRVDKIVGPGSLYVSAARRALAEHLDMGLPAGPSEAVVLADDSADPGRVALDLITEAEHGSDSSAFLVTPCPHLAEAVRRELPSLLAALPAQRERYVRDVLAGFGGIVITDTLEQALEFVNQFAPEHLQLACRQPLALVPRIENAGEILLGQNSAFSMANYAAGCNNVIPTGGWARTRSPLSVRDFLKSSSLLEVTGAGARSLIEPVASLAEYEGFSAHALAVRHRQAPAAGAKESGRRGSRRKS